MMQAVARVLAARQEDAALVQNGNWLLLTLVGANSADIGLPGGATTA